MKSDDAKSLVDIAMDLEEMNNVWAGARGAVLREIAARLSEPPDVTGWAAYQAAGANFCAPRWICFFPDDNFCDDAERVDNGDPAGVRVFFSKADAENYASRFDDGTVVEVVMRTRTSRLPQEGSADA